MAYKEENEKEFICRRCSKFLDTEDLVNGKCPNCKTDENIYINEERDLKTVKKNGKKL